MMNINAAHIPTHCAIPLAAPSAVVKPTVTARSKHPSVMLEHTVMTVSASSTEYTDISRLIVTAVSIDTCVHVRKCLIIIIMLSNYVCAYVYDTI